MITEAGYKIHKPVPVTNSDDYVTFQFIDSVKKRFSFLVLSDVTEMVFKVLYMTGLDQVMEVQPPEGYTPDEDAVSNSKNEQTRMAEPKEAERPEIALTGINDTTEEYPWLSVVDLFEEHALNHPEKMAIITPTDRITYGQLNEMSNRIAHFLLMLGVKSEDTIMIMLPRGLSTYIATLGILKSGAAYTIVNVNYPDERIDFIYHDAGCRYLISNKQTVIERLEFVADTLQRRPLYMEEMMTMPDLDNPDVTISPYDLC